jgi:hypothetical protein
VLILRNLSVAHRPSERGRGAASNLRAIRVAQKAVRATFQGLVPALMVETGRVSNASLTLQSKGYGWYTA